jgi:hypothetical protein
MKCAYQLKMRPILLWLEVTTVKLGAYANNKIKD